MFAEAFASDHDGDRGFGDEVVTKGAEEDTTVQFFSTECSFLVGWLEWSGKEKRAVEMGRKKKTRTL